MTVPDDQTTKHLAGNGPTPGTANASPLGFSAADELSDGRYVLRRRLGHGGMSTVWLAWDRRLERPVAIKILSDALAADSEYIRRFDREARIAAGLSHSNLVSIYDFEAGERPYLVMEYVEGGDLDERLRAGTAPDPVSLARDLLGAISHIHDAGVVHRDIKPKNVLIGADGVALLTDFGIARPSDATGLTRTGLVMGTNNFIAPEVMEGNPSDERSDLYALGVTLAEVAERAQPSRKLRKLIERLRDPDPGKRPASASVAMAMLERTPFAHGPPPVNPVEPSGRPPTVARAAEDSPTAGTRTPPVPAVAHPAPAAEAEPEKQRRGTERASRAMTVLALVATALAALAILIESSGDDGTQQAETAEPGLSGGGGEGQKNGGGDGNGGDDAETEPVVAAGASGAELNDQGYSLIQAGSPAEAVPILEQAVEELEGSGEITYAYALFNLGHALRLAGRPEEAIPILEQRLEIPNQAGVVRKELEAARADAGLEPES